MVSDDQLNGGVFADLEKADWDLIEPYLKENERLFGIKIQELMTVNGVQRPPQEIYRKVIVKGSDTVLKDTENH